MVRGPGRFPGRTEYCGRIRRRACGESRLTSKAVELDIKRRRPRPGNVIRRHRTQLPRKPERGSRAGAGVREVMGTRYRKVDSARSAASRAITPSEANASPVLRIAVVSSKAT